MGLIAIVGASNVGKSSLFNTLIGKNKAIVSDIPGTTRDRHFALYQDATYSFGLIDTGGLGDDEIILSNKLTEQTYLAIEQADLIWFVVDASEDTPNQTDYMLRNQLMKLKKPIFLVLNKCDKLNHVPVGFYELGFKKQYEVSSRTKKGIPDLLLDTHNMLPEPIEDLNQGVKIAIVGKPNVGKSSWINALLQEKRLITDTLSGTTRDTIEVDFTYQGQLFHLLDTAGLSRKDKHAKDINYYTFIRSMRSIQQTDIVAFMIDVEQGLTHHDRRLMGEISEIGKPYFILLNKTDLIKESKVFIDELRYQIPKYVDIFSISAKKRTGVKYFFSQSKKLYEKLSFEMTTNELNVLLIRLVENHQPPIINNRRIKLRYIHQISKVPMAFKIHGKQTHQLPQSYIRYLENSLREHLGLEGLPIKLFFKNDHNPYIGH